jgi:hypothetical protein
MALRASGELAAVQAVVTRAARLAEKGDLATSVLSAAGVVDAGLLIWRWHAPHAQRSLGRVAVTVDRASWAYRCSPGRD